ncbi:hypothetical protein RRG08_063829 [Elysia crispata]|uniref:Uncharacterized protein n=1 Tax=Elysia crispata TaxID=231223 RepID=A0AAE1DJP6_9GAST|nr:hypothetical protein RRG08_063829 [Elysia crispata]
MLAPFYLPVREPVDLLQQPSMPVYPRPETYCHNFAKALNFAQSPFYVNRDLRMPWVQNLCYPFRAAKACDCCLAYAHRAYAPNVIQSASRPSPLEYFTHQEYGRVHPQSAPPHAACPRQCFGETLMNPTLSTQLRRSVQTPQAIQDKRNVCGASHVHHSAQSLTEILWSTSRGTHALMPEPHWGPSDARLHRYCARGEIKDRQKIRAEGTPEDSIKEYGRYNQGFSHEDEEIIVVDEDSPV